MKTLKPRTILIIGVPAAFLLSAAPFAPSVRTFEDAFYTALAGVFFCIFYGLPIFGAMAWNSVMLHQESHNAPADRDRRFQYIERYFAYAGLLAIGYIVGWSVDSPFIHSGETLTTLLTGPIVLLQVSTAVMIFVVVAMIGRVKRRRLLIGRVQAGNAT